SRAFDVVTDPVWRQNLDMLRVIILSRTAGMSAVLELTEELLETSNSALRAQALSARAGALALSGKFDQAVAHAREAMADIEKWRDETPYLILTLVANWYAAALYAGDIDEAEQALAVLREQIGSHLDWHTADHIATLGRAQTLRMRGKLTD